MKYKVGTLIWDKTDQEWGIISDLEEDREYFVIIWCKCPDQTLYEFDLKHERFQIHEV